MDTGRISEGTGGSPGGLSSGSDKGEIRSVLDYESYSVSRPSKPPLNAFGEWFLPSFFQRLTGLTRGRRAERLEAGLAGLFGGGKGGHRAACSGPVIAEQDRMHDPSRDQREQLGDNQGAEENRDHDAAMVGATMLVRAPDRERHPGLRTSPPGPASDLS